MATSGQGPHVRVVVILCGPPGAGKSTAARASGMDVYDADDERWATEGDFVRGIARLAHDPDAHAVVIRSAATSTARARWRTLTQATHCLVIATDPDECARRVRARGRPRLARELVGLRRWWTRHERADGVRDFTTWADIGPATAPPPRQPPRPTKGRRAGYGYQHRQMRARWQQRIDAGETVLCWRCGLELHGTDWHLGHDDDDRSVYRGPECTTCNLRAGGLKSVEVRNERSVQNLQAITAEHTVEPTSRRW